VTVFDRVRASEVNRIKGMTAVLQHYRHFNVILKWWCLHVVSQKSLTKSKTSILRWANWNMYLFFFFFFQLKYLPILLPEFGFLSATYFAKNSAGKIYQGLRKMLVSSPGP